MATRALNLNPKLSHARYNRGLARIEMGLLRAARNDFATIMGTDPLFYFAKPAYDDVVSKIPEDALEEKTEISLPLYHALGDIHTDQDHMGNKKACRFYNHDGCHRGVKCSFMHAPDIESVRDQNGKNVCFYFLLGHCKFGDYSCIYSHSKSVLPEDGWWNQPEQVETIKVRMEKVKEEKKKVHEERIKAAQTDGKGNSKKPNGHPRKVPGRRNNALEAQRKKNNGFTDEEVMELACQGVKPWDAEARDVLNVIYGY